jgi:hypothetical protein
MDLLLTLLLVLLVAQYHVLAGQLLQTLILEDSNQAKMTEDEGDDSLECVTEHSHTMAQQM